MSRERPMPEPGEIPNPIEGAVRAAQEADRQFRGAMDELRRRDPDIVRDATRLGSAQRTIEEYTRRAALGETPGGPPRPGAPARGGETPPPDGGMPPATEGTPPADAARPGERPPGTPENGMDDIREALGLQPARRAEGQPRRGNRRVERIPNDDGRTETIKINVFGGAPATLENVPLDAEGKKRWVSNVLRRLENATSPDGDHVYKQRNREVDLLINFMRSEVADPDSERTAEQREEDSRAIEIMTKELETREDFHKLYFQFAGAGTISHVESAIRAMRPEILKELFKKEEFRRALIKIDTSEFSNRLIDAKGPDAQNQVLRDVAAEIAADMHIRDEDATAEVPLEVIKEKQEYVEAIAKVALQFTEFSGRFITKDRLEPKQKERIHVDAEGEVVWDKGEKIESDEDWQRWQAEYNDPNTIPERKAEMFEKRKKDGDVKLVFDAKGGNFAMRRLFKFHDWLYANIHSRKVIPQLADGVSLDTKDYWQYLLEKTTSEDPDDPDPEKRRKYFINKKTGEIDKENFIENQEFWDNYDFATLNLAQPMGEWVYSHVTEAEKARDAMVGKEDGLLRSGDMDSLKALKELFTYQGTQQWPIKERLTENLVKFLMHDREKIQGEPNYDKTDAKLVVDNLVSEGFFARKRRGEVMKNIFHKGDWLYDLKESKVGKFIENWFLLMPVWRGVKRGLGAGFLGFIGELWKQILKASQV